MIDNTFYYEDAGQCIAGKNTIFMRFLLLPCPSLMERSDGFQV